MSDFQFAGWFVNDSHNSCDLTAREKLISTSDKILVLKSWTNDRD